MTTVQIEMARDCDLGGKCDSVECARAGRCLAAPRPKRFPSTPALVIPLTLVRRNATPATVRP